MVIDDQREVLAFLGNPSHYGGDVSHVERIDTHTASVFLAGDRAFKLKRSVRYDYLDFSAPERRHHACEAEVLLNRRTAPSLYLGVITITREPDGSLAWNGSGPPVDWVVLMQRFEQDQLLDSLASVGRLPLSLMPALADAIAVFHEGAHPRGDYGGADRMHWVVDGNASSLANAGRILDQSVVAHLTHASRNSIMRMAALLDGRRARGMVRQCHGDLHLRNIVLLEGRPVLFDAIEFNEEIACIDVLYDLAFLLMDLLARDLPTHANVLFNRYLTRTDDLEGLRLMPLFLSCRAAIRAKTSLAAAGLQEDSGLRERLEVRASTYLALAERLIRAAAPELIAIGGPSGAGKSTLAQRLAPRFGNAPGAVIVRSDVIRKVLFGVEPETSLPASAYAPVVTQRVYMQLRHEVATALESGAFVIADATFAKEADRAAMEHLANHLGVPFTGLWLETDESVLARRLAERTLDASDATAAVMRRQLHAQRGELSWHHIDASGDPADTEERARRILTAQHRTGTAVA